MAAATVRVRPDSYLQRVTIPCLPGGPWRQPIRLVCSAPRAKTDVAKAAATSLEMRDAP